MGFFLHLFGFPENTYRVTQEALLRIATFTPAPTPHYYRERCDFVVASRRMVSAGMFSTPSVAELRARAKAERGNTDIPKGNPTTVKNIIGDARSMHSKEKCTAEGAVVQAASQFNYLEMPGPTVTPEAGVEGYEGDGTQGPSCAIACGAGTAYRNYLVPNPFPPVSEPNQIGFRRGQVESSQLNGLDGVEQHVRDCFGGDVGEGNDAVPWVVANGYVEAPSEDRLEEFNERLRSEPGLREAFVSKLKIGVQEDTAVTDLLSEGRIVTQTYNSAISIGYSRWGLSGWEPVARAVLDATYEATLLVGTLKTIEALSNGRSPPPILLTMVGGGVFRNEHSWIAQSIQNALERVAIYEVGLDVRIVHYSGIKPMYKELER